MTITITEEMREALARMRALDAEARDTRSTEAARQVASIYRGWAASDLARLVDEAVEEIERREEEARRAAEEEERRRAEIERRNETECGTANPAPHAVTVPTPNGPVETPVVEAQGGLAITHAIGMDCRPRDDRYTVTHLRSGLAIVSSNRDLGISGEVMRRLLEGGRWDRSAEEVQADSQCVSHARGVLGWLFTHEACAAEGEARGG